MLISLLAAALLSLPAQEGPRAPSYPSQRLETLPSGATGCERLERVFVDMNVWVPRAVATETGPMRADAVETVAQTMEDLAADQLGRDLAAELKDLKATMEVDAERRDGLIAEIKTLRDELMLAQINLCSRSR